MTFRDKITSPAVEDRRSVGKLPTHKATVAGVVPREVKEELVILQREFGLPSLSQAVGYALTAWYNRRKAGTLGLKPGLKLGRGPEGPTGPTSAPAQGIEGVKPPPGSGEGSP